MLSLTSHGNCIHIWNFLQTRDLKETYLKTPPPPPKKKTTTTKTLMGLTYGYYEKLMRALLELRSNRQSNCKILNLTNHRYSWRNKLKGKISGIF